jgi:hypothetical protein
MTHFTAEKLRVHDCKRASAVPYGDETYAYLTLRSALNRLYFSYASLINGASRL